MKPITDYPYHPDLLTSPACFWNCKTPESIAAYHKKLKRRSDNDHAALVSIAQENKKLFRYIATTVPSLDGWATPEKSCAMAALVLTMKPKIIVEVGLFAGRSVFGMAMAAKEIGGCKIIGIDAYSATVAMDSETAANADWWGKLDFKEIESKCRALLKNFQLESVVEIVVKKSDDFEPPPIIDLWHCDGAHTEQAVSDVERYAPKIPIGGIAIMDDLHWIFGGPARGVETLEDMGFACCYKLVNNNGSEVNDWGVWQRIK
jgi:predicted O-methyltransferase YrrM